MMNNSNNISKDEITIPMTKEIFEGMLKDIQTKYEAEKSCLGREILTYKKVIRMMTSKIK